MDYNERMELRRKRYNILVEQYLNNIFSDMNLLQFKIFRFLSPVENWLHWKREEYRDLDGDPKRYRLSKFLQALMWAIPFLSIKKGYQIVEGFEILFKKATPTEDS